MTPLSQEQSQALKALLDKAFEVHLEEQMLVYLTMGFVSKRLTEMGMLKASRDISVLDHSRIKDVVNGAIDTYVKEIIQASRKN